MRSNPPRVAAGLALLLALLAPARVVAQDEGIAVGAAAPGFTLPALDGTPVRLDSIIGRRPVLIEFWATWCGSCKAMLPRLREAHARWGKDVEFIGVNVTISETRDSVAAWVAREAPPFRTLWDADGDAARAFDAQATSFIVIIDRRGRVAYTGSGGTQNLEPALRRVAEP
jgi:thiol-disulfide isomerase/thioredoxin